MGFPIAGLGGYKIVIATCTATHSYITQIIAKKAVNNKVRGVFRAVFAAIAWIPALMYNNLKEIPWFRDGIRPLWLKVKRPWLDVERKLLGQAHSLHPTK
jgi:hypothetical protein